MSGRPQKTLLELVKDGSFRARRDSHRARLAGPELPYPGFALLQQRYQAAGSDPERYAVAREFEQAVQLVHQQTGAAATGTGTDAAEALGRQLARLGKPGSREQLLEFFPAYLRHPKGPLRGEPFRLERWQTAFLREFYRRDRHGRRVYRLGVLGLPRGNGKTALAAGLGLYELITRTDAPEIYFAAASRDQARVLLSFARSFVDDGPLAEFVTAASKLRCPATSGVLEVLASMGSLLHGRAPAASILDELWALQAFAQQETYTALTSALHKRVDSYLLAITTAGWDIHSLLGQIYKRALDEWPEISHKHNGCLTIAKDTDNGSLLWWYGAPSDADIENDKIWRACNPSSFVDLRDLRRQLHDPGTGEAGFRRLHLNQWTQSRDAWLPHGTWEKLASDDQIPTGASIYLGVDVGLTQDTTAVAWAHPTRDGQIILRCHVWSANPKAPAHTHITGKVQLEAVEQFIRDLARRYRVREVGYDPRFFDRSAELLERDGLTMVEFLPASAPIADAAQRFYQHAVTGTLRHDDDPVFAAHIAATAAFPTERGWKLSKLRSSQVIDATYAAVIATARADVNANNAPPTVHWL